MIRTVITPDQENILINLPKSFVGREVEVIAFTTDEGVQDQLQHGKKTFTVLEVEGPYKFDRDEANAR